MKKTWKLANGAQRKNLEGQLVLAEIGPSDFDNNYDLTQEALANGIAAPYHREGAYYVFARKRDWLAAIEKLEEAGWIL